MAKPKTILNIDDKVKVLKDGCLFILDLVKGDQWQKWKPSKEDSFKMFDFFYTLLLESKYKKIKGYEILQMTKPPPELGFGFVENTTDNFSLNPESILGNGLDEKSIIDKAFNSFMKSCIKINSYTCLLNGMYFSCKVLNDEIVLSIDLREVSVFDQKFILKKDEYEDLFYLITENLKNNCESNSSIEKIFEQISSSPNLFLSTAPENNYGMTLTEIENTDVTSDYFIDVKTGDLIIKNKDNKNKKRNGKKKKP